jgi:uncharacterized protein
MGRTSGHVRALLDANLLISALVSSDAARSAAAAVLFEAMSGAFVAVVPAEAIAEVARVAMEKPWLTARIPPYEIENLIQDLAIVADIPLAIERPLPRICRDPGDDYLIAHAILAQVDFLVTRDRDLLDLGDLGSVRIVDPVAFLSLLRSMQNDSSDSV